MHAGSVDQFRLQLRHLAALWLGRRVSFTPAADTALQLIARYGLDFIVASPQQLQALVEVQTQAPMPCGSLRVIHVGGSILTNAFIFLGTPGCARP